MPDQTRVQKTMTFVESAKGILTLITSLIISIAGLGGWLSTKLVFASDLAQQSMTFQTRQIESDERLARYQKNELENRIFLIDSRPNPTAQDQALRNRYVNQLNEVNRDLRELNAKKEALRK